MSSLHSSRQTHLFTPDAASNNKRVKNTQRTWMCLQNTTTVCRVAWGLIGLSLHHVIMCLLNPGSNPTMDLCNMSSSSLSPCVYCHPTAINQSEPTMPERQSFKNPVFLMCICSPWRSGHSALSGVAVSRGQTNLIDYYFVLLVVFA